MSKIPTSSTGMLLDGCFLTEHTDSSAEKIHLKGVDVSSFDNNEGTVNYEHRGDEGNGRETVGKVLYCKKIYSLADCDTDRQRDYWKMGREVPFLYGVVRLFDGAGHAEAQALAAAIRDHVANGEPISLKWSIEGTTTRKEGNEIKACAARRVALTWKACNKAAVSGLLADPNAPPGFEKTFKSEKDLDPRFMPLGGALELTYDPRVDQQTQSITRLLSHAAAFKAVRKALSAGSYDAAPSTLTGGSALQREDLHGAAFATLRDYGWSKPYNRNKFKLFAKSKLPEVSPEFLDHFADVAEGLALKRALIKKERITKPKLPKKPGAMQHSLDRGIIEEIADADEQEPAIPTAKGTRKIASLTYRGKFTKPNVGMVRPSFDPKKGVLHTPAGSIRAYLPKHDGKEAAEHYQKLLSHPDIEKAMDTALTNWSELHKRFKAGTVPPEVIMHGMIFSSLSPNKAVPQMEVQYARLADAMDATGIDPREPGFEAIEEPYFALDKPDVLPHTAREEFKRNPAYYQGGKIGVERDLFGNKIGDPSPETGRYPGELLSGRPLFYDFLDRARHYHKLHNGIVDLLQRHKGNGLDAVTELMNSKRQAENWRNSRRTAVAAGKPDPGEFKGLSVPGIKVKTGLYALGMLGNGDSLVPDTHLVRNMYGLDLERDAPTIDYLKNLHWRPTNMESVMRPLNEWYLKNHPAVQYTLNHPKWGSVFERPQDALFPSFWRHWLTIQPHEAHLGLPNMSEQAGTTHAPYWETIRPFLEAPEDAMEKAVEEPDSSVALRTALVHQQYVKDFGEVPAMLLYYHHLVPKLLEAAERRRRTGNDMQFLAKARKLEAELIELRKDVHEALRGPAEPDVRAVYLRHGDHNHPAGRFLIHDNQVHHLEDYHGLLGAMLPEGPLNATAVSRLHGMQWSPNLGVVEHRTAPLPPPETKVPETSQVTVAQVPVPHPAPVFEYHRPGLARPHVVEFSPQGAALDGKALSDAELALMLRNASTGLATIRYRKATGLAKAEGDEMGPEEALHNLVGRHPESAQELSILRRHLFEDPMVPGVGNKLAYNQFREKNKPGIYIGSDLDDFRSINNLHGHDAGDAAIKAAFGAIRDAAAKTGGLKVYRSGGDEGLTFAPTYEHAARFLRNVRENLDALPPVNGVHKISASFGLGNDYHTADRALYEAKKRKTDSITGQRAFPVGKVPSGAHSLVPGTEGPIHMHSEQPPAQHLPVASPSKP